ncbi:hypothetical protein Xszus_01541 [Xenorhabdus szentirmaii]|uniref:Uncharacterized protein n=1 Tax=Xenorhabdus szentirmaii DSM 16338 TaxID=1427518 RepID=W1IX86_9GAMM|nr:hypothetical protein Xsze_02493 [Xenorhabdus szentirmaii DSM 16338]PHM41836.1 hypothetical protein Xszus_01541 [Xenorhabdus szentirmaii]CDL83059.1 hypothetical protein XSR1_280041 [Xenorhabdus szentirmaii DSM 16338]
MPVTYYACNNEQKKVGIIFYCNYFYQWIDFRYDNLIRAAQKQQVDFSIDSFQQVIASSKVENENKFIKRDAVVS